MRAETIQALAAVVAADATATREEREAVLAAARGERAAEEAARVVPHAEAARRTGYQARRLRQLAQAGVLVRVGRAGYTARSVAELCEGRRRVPRARRAGA